MKTIPFQQILAYQEQQITLSVYCMILHMPLAHVAVNVCVRVCMCETAPSTAPTFLARKQEKL